MYVTLSLLSIHSENKRKFYVKKKKKSLEQNSTSKMQQDEGLIKY